MTVADATPSSSGAQESPAIAGAHPVTADRHPARHALRQPPGNDGQFDREMAMRRVGFRARRPMTDIHLRWLVVLTPIALAALATLFAVNFEVRYSEYRDGRVPDEQHYVRMITELIGFLGLVGVVGIAALALWSWLTVTNTNRVGHSLRTAWFAALGWLLVPAIAVAAHLTLDARLDSGALSGLTAALVMLYLPFGTLAGAASDLGGKPHIVRVWYMTSVISAFLLMAGLSGSTSALPVEHAQRTMQVRSIACYLAALMLLASAALAFTAANELHSMISHRWAREVNPEGTSFEHAELKIMRRGRSHHRMIPTLFMRVIFVVGLVAVSLVSVMALFMMRSRGLRNSGTETSADRRSLADYREITLQLGLVAVAMHGLFALWAIVSAINARRRSLLAPTPLAITGAVVAGPILLLVSVELRGPLSWAVLVAGVVVSICGFVVAQLVLGRTVSALGGSGRVFLGWLLLDGALIGFAALVARNSSDRFQIIIFGIVQTALTMLAAWTAWKAMTSLDRACRDRDNTVDSYAAPEPWVHGQIVESPSLVSV